MLATADNPVLLYSIGKDSAVLLHLALKAFYPAPLPFPLLHVDTTWKFREMIEFRDRRAKELDCRLIVHINEDGLRAGVNPFTSGSRLHTDVMKTQALKQAFDRYKFDAAFGGARRDEEKSRAKERVFSLRSAEHRWDPKISAPNPGTCSTRASEPARASASFRYRTGPRLTSGTTSPRKTFPSCRFTSPPRAR